jgi:hypothetical protein
MGPPPFAVSERGLGMLRRSTSLGPDGPVSGLHISTTVVYQRCGKSSPRFGTDRPSHSVIHRFEKALPRPGVMLVAWLLPTLTSERMGIQVNFG